MTIADTQPVASRTPEWGPVISIAVGVGALITTELLPISMLTPIAADLRISEGLAGQAVTVTAGVGLVASLLVAPVTWRLDRRVLMVGLSSLMVASNVIAALAPNLVILMIARVLLGISLGGIWSMAPALAIRLVPAESIPRALSIIFGGSSIATVIATPLGSALAASVGWRGVFVIAGVASALALAWQCVALPGMPPQGRARLSTLLNLLGRGPVAKGILAVLLSFTGTFAFFTYLRPIIASQTGVGDVGISGFLLILGIGGFVGTLIAGKLLARSLKATAVGIPLVMAFVVIALAFAGSTLTVAVLLVALWGVASGMMPVAWSTWLSQTVPNDAESGGGLLVASMQLAITAGAAIGGFVLDRAGQHGTLLASAALLMLAGGAALLVRADAPQPD